MAVLYGPVQLVVIGLENDKLRGQVSRELHHASEQGYIRILDALAIQKTEGGSVYSLGGSDLSTDERVRYGAILGGLMGFGATGTEEGLEAGAEMGAETFADHNFGLTRADIQAIAADIPPGKTALLVLFEHRWAIPLKEELVKAGGVVLAQGMVQPEAIMALGAHISDAALAAQSSQASQTEQIH